MSLGVGADFFCGLAFWAVGVEANVGVEIGNGGLIIILAEMDQGEQPVDFRLLWSEGLRCFRRVQRGLEMHTIELELSQFVVAGPGAGIQFETATEEGFTFRGIVAAQKQDGKRKDGIRVSLIAE